MFARLDRLARPRSTCGSTSQTSEMATGIVRGIADVVCFGGFFALGVSGHHLRYKLSRSWRWGLAVLFGAAGLAAAFIAPPIDMVVNNSYVLLGLVGLSWLLVMLALEDQLRHLGQISAIKRIRRLDRRQLDVHLPVAHAGARVRLLPRGRTDLARPVRHPRRRLRRADRLDGHRRRARSSRSARTRNGAVRACASSRSSPSSSDWRWSRNQPTLFPRSTEVARPARRRRVVRRSAATVRRAIESDESAGDVDPADMARSGEAWLRGNVVDAAAVIEIGAVDRRATAPRAVRRRDGARPRCPVRGAEHHQDDGRRRRPAAGRRGASSRSTGRCRRSTASRTRRTDTLHVAPSAQPLHRHPRLPRERRLSRRHDPDAGRGGEPRGGRTATSTRPRRATPPPTSCSPDWRSRRSRAPPQRGARRTALRRRSAWTHTAMVNNSREGFVGQASGGVVSTLADLGPLVRRADA